VTVSFLTLRSQRRSALPLRSSSYARLHVQERLESIIAETCVQMDCELLEFGGEHDHVHCLVAVHPKLAVASLVAKLKGKSSFLLRRKFWAPIKTKLWGTHFWSPSYCVVSCGGASLNVVKAYIEQQRTPASEAQVRQSKAIAGNSKAGA
jgi:putative transposase